ncbi:hypothetical protein WJX75_000591 [Coccomyxa subellipsoidea]|uniref:Uncharacterized protein n=1 Tax=Coccomyxa subellipsoidea TaxID=248742 RepID=A0ABR2YUK6_9CHLO
MRTRSQKAFFTPAANGPLEDAAQVEDIPGAAVNKRKGIRGRTSTKQADTSPVDKGALDEENSATPGLKIMLRNQMQQTSLVGLRRTWLQ